MTLTQDERDEIVWLLKNLRNEDSCHIDRHTGDRSTRIDGAIAALTREPAPAPCVHAELLRRAAGCQAAEWGDGPPCNPHELESELCVVCRIRRAAEEMP